MIGYQNITVNGSSTAKWGSTRLRVALALDNTGSMADDGKMTALKTRDQGPAHAIAERRRHQRRRLCLDHSVQQGRQCRRRAITMPTGSTGTTGKTTTAAAQHDDLHAPRRRQERQELATGTTSTLGARQPQYLERLHHRSRIRDYDQNVTAPDQNVTAPADNAPLDALPGRAVRQLPAGDDGSQLQLDGDEQSGRSRCTRTATPTSRSAWSGLAVAGRRRSADRAGEGFELHLYRTSSC